MKKLLLILPLAWLIACGPDREQGTATLVLKNQLNMERIDELVILERRELERRLGEIGEGQVVLVSWDGKAIPSQQDDLDLDGQWDELAFVVDLAPNQELELSLRVVDETEKPEFEKRTNVRFGRIVVKGEEYEEITEANRLQGTNTEVTQQHFQFEGPGWENDKVGFRNYFDERNGMDIWGKTTSEMVLDRVGINENYHVMQPWGMDILKVANSLGAGALALRHNDSLYRVTAPEGATYRLVAEGPVRSILNLDFNRMVLDGNELAVKHQISIVAGEYAYRSLVTVDNAPSGLQVVTGIVNLQTEQMYLLEKGQAHVVYTHDRQSFDEEYLGMAVLAPKNQFKETFATPEEGPGITQTFAVSLSPNKDNQVNFRFYACWEITDASFADRNNFEQFLTNEAERFANPVRTSLK